MQVKYSRQLATIKRQCRTYLQLTHAGSLITFEHAVLKYLQTTKHCSINLHITCVSQLQSSATLSLNDIVLNALRV